VPSSDPRRRYADIVHEIDLIEEFVGGRPREAVEQDIKAVRAVERSFQIISEAAAKLGAAAEAACPDQAWLKIRNLGNVLRHAYEDVLFSRLWTTIEDELPSLRRACQGQLDKPQHGDPP
jgi:uncharacterized protein with HEPN domain